MDGLLALSTPGWAGLAALGGALIGGLVAGGATYVVEHGRQDFERNERERDRTRDDEARRATVRGIARVLQGRFLRERTIWQAALELGVFPPQILQNAAPLSDTDQQLLAANVSIEEWNAIINAEAVLGGMRAIRDQAANSPDAEGSVGEVQRLWLKDPEAKGVRDLIGKLDEASSALTRLSN